MECTGCNQRDKIIKNLKRQLNYREKEFLASLEAKDKKIKGDEAKNRS